jgi:hypothetical protein
MRTWIPLKGWSGGGERVRRLSWLQIAWAEVHVVIDFPGGVSAGSTLKLSPMCTCVGDAVTESGKSPDQPCNSGAFPCIKCTPGYLQRAWRNYSPPHQNCKQWSVMSLLYPVFPELTAVPTILWNSQDVQGGGWGRRERGRSVLRFFFLVVSLFVDCTN